MTTLNVLDVIRELAGHFNWQVLGQQIRWTAECSPHQDAIAFRLTHGIGQSAHTAVAMIDGRTALALDKTELVNFVDDTMRRAVQALFRQLADDVFKPVPLPDITDPFKFGFGNWAATQPGQFFGINRSAGWDTAYLRDMASIRRESEQSIEQELRQAQLRHWEELGRAIDKGEIDSTVERDLLNICGEVLDDDE